MWTFVTELAQSASQTDVFWAGIGLGLLGVMLAMGRMVYGQTRGLILRRLALVLTVDNRSSAYRDLLVWLDKTGALAKGRRLRLGGHHFAGRETLSPANGSHWFWAKGRLCRLTRSMDRKSPNGRNGALMEELTLTIYGGSRSLVERWLAEARSMVAAQERRGPQLHILRHDYWESLGEIPPRRLESVVADDDRVDRLAADMERFFRARDWYGDRGVPWRRGYLLYGPPGTGKSSTIRAIASHLGRDLATLDLRAPEFGDDALRQGLTTAPRGCLIVIEDIDGIFAGREVAEGKTGVSFSGLLNAIDGVAAQEGRALVMTTNHRERLDPALIRPGRVDVQVELDLISGDAAAAMFRRFFPGDDAQAEAFRRRLGPGRFAPAQVQAWLLSAGEDPGVAALATDLVPAISLAAE